MSATRPLERVFNAVLVVCCLTVTSLSVRQQFFKPERPLPPRPEKSVPSRPLPAGVVVGDHGLRIGPERAALTIVECADFECPFCSVASGELKEMRAKYPDVIAIRFRHMPIEGHVNAWPAALAAECVAEQGSFEPFYYRVYAESRNLSKPKLRKLAANSGVKDLAEFDRCVASERYRQRIEQDIAMASLVGVVGTPTWVIGDSVFGGMPSVSQIEQWVLGAQAGSA